MTVTIPADDGAVLRARDDGRHTYRAGRAPAGLATRKQLRAQGLSTAGLEPAGWLHYSALHGVCALYEIAAARPVRPLSERQRAALAAGRVLVGTWPCPDCDGRMRRKRRRCQECADRARAEMLRKAAAGASAWAGEVLADSSAVLLDCETTGLHGPVYMAQLAVVDVAGTVLLDTLMNPQVPIPADASAVHGITDEMVAGAPTFAELTDRLAELLRGRRVVIYNAAFDIDVVRCELDRHLRRVVPIDVPDWEWHPGVRAWLAELGPVECAMEAYARWYGDYSDYHRDWTWQPLGGGHDARGDCLAVLARLREMAASAGRDVVRQAVARR